MIVIVTVIVVVVVVVIVVVVVTVIVIDGGNHGRYVSRHNRIVSLAATPFHSTSDT